MMPIQLFSSIIVILSLVCLTSAADGDIDGSKPPASDPIFLWPLKAQSEAWWQRPVQSRGSTLNATWSPLDRLADRGFAPPAKILLEYGGRSVSPKVWTTIAELDPTATKHDWKVPDALDEGRDYKLRVVPKDPPPQGQIGWPGIESGEFQVYVPMNLKAAATNGGPGIEDVSFGEGNWAAKVRACGWWMAVASVATVVGLMGGW